MRGMTRARRTAGLALVAVLAACSRNPQAASPTPQAAPAVSAPPPAAPAQSPAPNPVAPAAAPAPAPAPAAAAPTPAAAAAPTPAAAAQPAPTSAAATHFNLAGEWEWTATFQGQLYGGTMSFQGSGDGYTGIMRVAGQFDATVRTATVAADTVRATLDSPQGEMMLEAVFTDADTMTGLVYVLAAGEAASFSATRQR
jgi:hypothetical protein